MRETWSSHETWVFECLNCMTTWEEEFDIRHGADGHGGETVVYEHDGHLCPTPWVDHPCPDCKSPNVKAVHAPPWARHRQATPPTWPDDIELVNRLRRRHHAY
jgi:hypothetical protein